MLPSLYTVSAVFAASISTTLAAPAGSSETGFCADLATAIPTNVDATPFCRSYISIATRPTYIFVNDPSTTVSIITAPVTVVETVATSTLTFCDGRSSASHDNSNNNKRQVSSSASITATGLSPAEKTSEACSCLSIPPETVTHTITNIAHTTIVPTITASITAYETWIGPSSRTTIQPPVLVSATPISYAPYSDASLPISVPFAIGYGNISSLNPDGTTAFNISVSNNGVISLTPYGSNVAGNTPGPLPHWRNNGSTLALNAFAVLWGPHSVNSSLHNPMTNASQKVQYAVSGSAPQRTLTIEWVVGGSRLAASSNNIWKDDLAAHYHFTACFFENSRDFTYTYYHVGDAGKGATVGAQARRDIGYVDNDYARGDWVQFVAAPDPGYGFDVSYRVPETGVFGAREVVGGMVLRYLSEGNSFEAATLYEGLC